MANRIIDVSSNNGNIDWAKVKADGVTDAIIRTSLGFGDLDLMAIKNAKGANNVSLKLMYYHFAYPDKKQGYTYQQDANNEANYFCDKISQMPRSTMLAVDLEKDTSNTNWGNGQGDTNLSSSEYEDWLKIFLSTVHSKTGLNIMIYSYKDYLDSHLPVSHNLGSFPLWIANYNSVPSPPLPKGWSDYYLWQFSKSGAINGISTPCDLDKLKITLEVESWKKT